MTEQDRIDREALLRRAGAVAGAVYAAPVLTPSAAAGIERPRRCRAGKKCGTLRDCRNRKGETCICCPENMENPFTCQRSWAACGGCKDNCVGSAEPCDSLHQCGGNCGCFILAASGGQHLCVELRNGLCASYPPCDKNTGSGCPPGMCCLDTCCPMGICTDPKCYSGSHGPVRGSGGVSGAPLAR